MTTPHATRLTVDDDVIEVSDREIELLMRWRQLPRPVREAVRAVVWAAAPNSTNLATLPTFANLETVAHLYHLSVKTLRRKCSEGSFSPAPARKYPYLWRREDIVSDITGPSKRLPRRAHGFAKAKIRRALTAHDVVTT